MGFRGSKVRILSPRPKVSRCGRDGKQLSRPLLLVLFSCVNWVIPFFPFSARRFFDTTSVFFIKQKRIWNGKIKKHDLEKIAHYAELAWMLSGGIKRISKTLPKQPGLAMRNRHHKFCQVLGQIAANE